MSILSKTLKSDWPFIVLTTLTFIAGLLAAAWDFIYLQGAARSLGLLNGSGLALFVGGTMRVREYKIMHNCEYHFFHVKQKSQYGAPCINVHFLSSLSLGFIASADRLSE